MQHSNAPSSWASTSRSLFLPVIPRRTDHMLARTYATPLQRFLSPDPGRDGWNLYGYAANNPINFVDPDGESPAKAFLVLARGTDAVEHAEETAREVGSLAAGFVPVVGDIKDVQEVLTGKDLVTGEELSGTDRAATGLAMVLPVVNGKLVREGLEALSETSRHTTLLGNLGREGAGRGVREVVGTSSDARKLFDELRGSHEVAEVKPGVFVAKAEKGGTLTLREKSKSGPPTVDVHGVEEGVRKIKFVEQ